MKYVLLFVEEEEFARDLEAMGPAERARAYQRVAEWMDTHAGKIRGGNKLQAAETATTVRLGGVTKFAAELLIILVAPTHPNDDERRSEEIPMPQAEQRRKQLAVGQSIRCHEAAVTVSAHANPGRVDIGFLGQPPNGGIDVLEFLHAQLPIRRPGGTGAACHGRR